MQKGVVVHQNSDFVKLLSGENNIYYIFEDIDLGGKKIKIGSGSTLYFRGGSLSNGTLIGNGTYINAKNYEIFKHGVRKYRGFCLNGNYKYSYSDNKTIIIEGSWNNTKCGYNWTGMSIISKKDCASLSINNYIRLHKLGSKIVFPSSCEFYVYDHINCSGYSIDFNHSTLRSIDFNDVEDYTIKLPQGAVANQLKSLYGLVVFNCNDCYLKNLTLDGRAKYRKEKPSLGTECLLSMDKNSNCQLENIILEDAVGCAICTYTISNCNFKNIDIINCGEHGIYTHAYEGSLIFDNCRFIDCGQDEDLYKKRGQSACIKFSGSRDRDYSKLKQLYAFFSNCLFQSHGNYPVATTYADLPYAEFNHCRWEGNVNGYSVVSPYLAEKIGHLVEYKFIDCINPCSKINSINTIRRLIRCKEVSNPFADTVELTDCEILVGYSDINNKYSDFFISEYTSPMICKRCRFINILGDISIRNTIISPRPMVFKDCKWEFGLSETKKNRGTYYLVLSESKNIKTAPISIMFIDCSFNIDKYRLLYCDNSEIEMINCTYLSSYGSLIDAKEGKPNKIRVKGMKNKKNLIIARNYILDK